jgi:myo-inositol-1(or 4)-monophosphatase
MKSIIPVAIDAAREAGEYLRANHRTTLTVETKEDRSLVTNVDRWAERLIAARIEAAFPGHDIIGEERGRTSRGSDYAWIIDPLDGTHNYIRGMGTYGVSIGVMRGDSFVAGVIFMPETDEMYAAERGSGAFRNGKRVAVSTRSVLSMSTLAFDSELRRETERKLRALGDLSSVVFNVRMFGSSARTLSHIAEGVLDGIIEFSDKLWDFAAGVVLIEEAGGRMTGFAGSALTSSDTAYVASNGLIHEELRRIAESA